MNGTDAARMTQNRKNIFNAIELARLRVPNVENTATFGEPDDCTPDDMTNIQMNFRDGSPSLIVSIIVRRLP